MSNQKPSSKPVWTVGNPDINLTTIEPSGDKKMTGWEFNEKPPHEYMNWLFYNIGQWIDHLENPRGEILEIDDSDSPYTANTDDRWIAADTSGGNILIDLPAVLNNEGVEYLIVKMHEDNTVTIDKNAAEYISDRETVVLRQKYEAVRIKEVGGQWAIVAHVRPYREMLVLDSNPQSLTPDQTEFIFLLDTTAEAINIQLPTPKAGLVYTFIDIASELETNAATLLRSGSENIEGSAANFALRFNGGKWKLTSDGTNWFFLQRPQATQNDMLFVGASWFSPEPFPIGWVHTDEDVGIVRALNVVASAKPEFGNIDSHTLITTESKLGNANATVFNVPFTGMYEIDFQYTGAHTWSGGGTGRVEIMASIFRDMGMAGVEALFSDFVIVGTGAGEQVKLRSGTNRVFLEAGDKIYFAIEMIPRDLSGTQTGSLTAVTTQEYCRASIRAAGRLLGS